MMEYLALHPGIHFTKRSVPTAMSNWKICQNARMRALLCDPLMAVSSRIYPAVKHGNSSKQHKEIHRFDRSSYARANKYIELLDEWANSPVLPADEIQSPVVIHYTPQYLYAPSVPFDLKQMYSGIRAGADDSRPLKFVLMLRSPVSRALSSYWFKNSHLFDTQDKDRGMCACSSGSLLSYPVPCRLPGGVPVQRSAAGTEIQVGGCYFTVLIDVCYRSRVYSCRDHLEGCLGGLLNLTHSEGVLEEWRKYQELSSGEFYDVLKRCYNNPGRTSAVPAAWSGPRSLFRSRELGQHHLGKGIYYDQLMRWFHCFPPRRDTAPSGMGAAHPPQDSVGAGHVYCLLYYEDFLAAPVQQYARLLECLGVDVLSEVSARVIAGLRRTHSGIHALKAPNKYTRNVFPVWDKSNPIDEPHGSTRFRNKSFNWMDYGLAGLDDRELRVAVDTLADYYKPYNDKLDVLLEAVFG